MKFWNKRPRRVYLDFAAATPLLPLAKVAMEPFLLSDFGNPGAVHKEGALARQAINRSREMIAQSLKVRPEAVTFTSGGTEANNLAVLGRVRFLHQAGRPYNKMAVITTKIEHPSILRTMDELIGLGVTVKYVSVNERGKIILSELKSLLSAETILVSCSYVNSEIGTIQPLHAIRKELREAEGKYETEILLHVDGAQAPLWLNCQLDSVGADFLTLDSAKNCGPKGVGILVQSKRAKVASVIFGGGQEAGLRPGTENVAGIVGAGVALQLAQNDWLERSAKVKAVRDEGIEFLLREIPAAVLNGAEGKERVTNNINISIAGLDTEYATVVLDATGFAVSTKSACAGAGGGESVVVKVISGDPARASSTLRLTLGPDTTLEQLKKLTLVLKTHIEQMKKYK